MNILFVTSNRLGDAVLSTGVLARLLEDYPQARVTIACGPFASGIFRAVPRLDRLIILRKRSFNRHWLEFWRSCIGTKWDLIVDLRNSLAARLLRHKRYAGLRKRTGRHKVVDNGSILQFDPPPWPRFWLDQAAEDAADKLIPSDGNVLALGPAANWPCKQWPIERFAELTRALTATDGILPDAAVLVLADTKERSQLEHLLADIPESRKIALVGQNLLTVAACMRRCRVFIGNDSGLMHMAAALDMPTLGLFGPGYPDIYGPWGKQTAFVRTVESREELLARLPYPGAHEPNLMQGLSVERVVEGVRTLLARKPD